MSYSTDINYADLPAYVRDVVAEANCERVELDAQSQEATVFLKDMDVILPEQLPGLLQAQAIIMAVGDSLTLTFQTVDADGEPLTDTAPGAY